MRRLLKNKWIRLGLCLILFATYCVVMTLLVGTACPFSLLTGLPCPACGMTRANLLALSLRFDEAFAMHPMFFMSVVALGLAVFCTARPDLALRKWVGAAAIACTAAFIGVYIYRMIAFYPDTQPMVYNYDSLFGLLRRLWGF